jgi:hypothetical protein
LCLVAIQVPIERLIPAALRVGVIVNLLVWLVFLLVWLVFILVGTLVLFLVEWVASPALLRKGPSGVLSDLSESFRLPDLEPDELLVVRAPGDEASSGLGATRVFSLLLDYVSRTLGRIYAGGEWLVQFDQRMTRLQRFLIFLPLSLAGIAAIWAMYLLGRSPSDPLLPWAGLLVVVGTLFLFPPNLFPLFNSLLTMIGSLLEFIAGALLLPVIVLLSVVTAPFGIDAGLLAAFFELSAETTPPGSFEVFQLHDSISPGLRHSLTYSDDATLHAIVKWIACLQTRKSP